LGIRLSGTHGLCARERQVLELPLENRANKEVASRLNISDRTVKFHVSNLLAKYGVGRRADLILLWCQKRSAASPIARDDAGQFYATLLILSDGRSLSLPDAPEPNWRSAI